MMKQDTKREVYGEFPEFCYKAFACEEHAKQFMDSGFFRLNCRYYCREMEDESRRDPTEGSGCTLEPGIVTSVSFSRNRAEKPIVTREPGHQKYETEFGEGMFHFCTCLPKVNLDYMRKHFGRYIVKINDPRKLAVDIDEYFISDGQRFQIEGWNVVYNKGQKLPRKLTDNKRLDLSYKQKPESFIHDCEFRIVAIKFGEPCKEECKFLSGQFEQVESECRFIPVNLGKKLDYISLVNSE